MHIRDAVDADLVPLARLWHQGWTDAHAGILPEALARLRTAESDWADVRGLLRQSYLRLAPRKLADSIANRPVP